MRSGGRRGICTHFPLVNGILKRCFGVVDLGYHHQELDDARHDHAVLIWSLDLLCVFASLADKVQDGCQVGGRVPSIKIQDVPAVDHFNCFRELGANPLCKGPGVEFVREDVGETSEKVFKRRGDVVKDG